MLPQVFGLVRDLFPPDQMGKAWAVLGPVSGLSAVLGPIVAGLLIDADILGTGWRSIFLVNVPVGAFVLLVGARFLPEGAPAERTARGSTSPACRWPAPAPCCWSTRSSRAVSWAGRCGCSGCSSRRCRCSALFARHQARRKRSGATTLVEPSVFRNRSYVSGAGFAMVFLGSMGGLTLALTGAACRSASATRRSRRA